MEEIFHEKATFNAKLTNLYQILIWINERIAKYLPERDLDRIELAAEEVIVNIISHAYKNKNGNIQVQIYVNQCINLIFKDKGPKFNPLIKKNFHRRKNVKRIGGVGIFLILRLADEVQYQRKDDANILILRMKRNIEY
ncbi:MAG: ATP-binding protein [Parachlamydiales bacterium]|jgi:anti-sigma regulatory factor (Ser/Thr protein kinase)